MTSISATVRKAMPRRPVRALISLTESAKKQLQKILSGANPRPLGVRLGVKARGCSGLSYTLELAQQKNKFEEEVEINGVKLFITPNALLHVIGTEMDFIEEKVTSEFVFYNPNIKDTCGCGQSFITDPAAAKSSGTQNATPGDSQSSSA